MAFGTQKIIFIRAFNSYTTSKYYFLYIGAEDTET